MEEFNEPMHQPEPQQQPSGEGTAAQPPFMVDLTREEYVAFQMEQARVRGPLRFRVASLIISLILLAMVVVTLVLDIRSGSPLDPVLAVIGVLTLVPALGTWFVLPYSLKKRAGKSYDQARCCGNTFYGELRIYPNHVEKIGEAASAKIPLNGQSFFMETKDMMAFTTSTSLALVLPARCMTPEMAQAVRAAADQLPMGNRRFVSRFQPQSRLAAAPETVAKPTVLWQQDITFTEEEYASMVKAVMMVRYWRMAPWFMIISVLGGLTFNWDGTRILPSILGFLFFFLLLTALNLWLPMSRIKRQAAASGQQERTYRITLDEVAFRVEGFTKQEMAVVWSEVNHVYNKDEFVEFNVQKYSLFRIPKRCIADFAAFEKIVDHCRETK